MTDRKAMSSSALRAKGERWTDAQLMELVCARHDGATLAELAKGAGLSREGVRRAFANALRRYDRCRFGAPMDARVVAAFEAEADKFFPWRARKW